MLIRPMISTDLGEITRIEGDTLSPWSLRSLKKELESDQAIQLVAETLEQQILGWCGCRIIWPEAELMKIAVAKKSRKDGVGSSLLKYLFDELKKRNVVALFLEVRSQNKVAMRLYEKHFFVQVGLRSKYYNSPPDSAVLLKRNLSQLTLL